MHQITRKNRGCGMMPFPEKIEKIVENILSNTSCRFSLKIRMGLHSRDEARDLLQRMNSYPLDFVCIHPRLGDWQYEGLPNRDEFQKLLSISKHKIIYNGDIVSQFVFKELQNQFISVDEWMLGRGLLMNPFLAEEIKGLTTSKKTQQQRFIRFHRHLVKLLVKLKGEKTALAAMKELWHYFAVFWNLDDNALKKILRSKDLDEILQQISVFSYADFTEKQYFCN
jgi:tRNA-dihydrouridine synthase